VGGADDIYYDAATGRIYFTGSTGTVAVFKEIDPDHFQLLGKVPTGAVSKTGLWVPELKRFYSAVPQHFVLTVPHGTKDFRADLLKELNLKEGEVAPILSNMIVEEAHLMVFDYFTVSDTGISFVTQLNHWLKPRRLRFLQTGKVRYQPL